MSKIKLLVEVDESEIVECWNEQAAKELGYQEYALKKCPEIKVKPYNPSGDLISRETLRAKMKEADAEAIDYEMLVAMYEKLVNEAPVVEPERLKGEWLSQGYGYFCSICHIYHENSNFCPNCGAQMLKGDAE